MVQIQNILTGTDFTEHSCGSVREAIRLALRFDATLHVLHVRDGNAEEEEVLSRIEAFVQNEAPDPALKLQTVTRVGGVSEGLAGYADEAQVDLVCIGPRARGFVEKHFTGGPAQQLIGRTRRATLITHAAWDKGYHHILVPTGLSDVSAKALKLAAHLAEGDTPTLRVLHVLSGTSASKLHSHGGAQMEEALKAEARAQVQAFVQETLDDPSRFNIELELHFGAISRWIKDVASQQEVDLVCIGTVGRKGLSAFFAGNTAGSLVRQIPCPMVVAYP